MREEGVARFVVSEVLFDVDFPGHYLRRVRSVAVTVPCVVGPYASVSAALRLLFYPNVALTSPSHSPRL